MCDQNGAQRTLTWTLRLGMGEWEESSDDIEQEKLCQLTDRDTASVYMHHRVLSAPQYVFTQALGSPSQH